MNIKQALLALDKENDVNWTTDGLPRLDVVKQTTGDTTLTRDKLTIAFPGFNRETEVAVNVVTAPKVTTEKDVVPEQGEALAVEVQTEIREQTFAEVMAQYNRSRSL